MNMNWFEVWIRVRLQWWPWSLVFFFLVSEFLLWSWCIPAKRVLWGCVSCMLLFTRYLELTCDSCGTRMFLVYIKISSLNYPSLTFSVILMHKCLQDKSVHTMMPRLSILGSVLIEKGIRFWCSYIILEALWKDVCWWAAHLLLNCWDDFCLIVVSTWIQWFANDQMIRFRASVQPLFIQYDALLQPYFHLIRF